jgi:hypothetical protein
MSRNDFIISSGETWGETVLSSLTTGKPSTLVFSMAI